MSQSIHTLQMPLECKEYCPNLCLLLKSSLSEMSKPQNTNSVLPSLGPQPGHRSEVKTKACQKCFTPFALEKNNQSLNKIYDELHNFIIKRHTRGQMFHVDALRPSQQFFSLVRLIK